MLHLTLVLAVPTFLGLFWWQVQRVRQGNTLSWAYVFEWPFFTGYAVYLWWKLVHDQPGLHETAVTRTTTPVADVGTVGSDAPRTDGDRSPGAVVAAPFDAGSDGAAAALDGADDLEGQDEEQEELAAYNRYLAALNASGRRKRW